MKKKQELGMKWNSKKLNKARILRARIALSKYIESVDSIHSLDSVDSLDSADFVDFVGSIDSTDH